MEHIFDWPGKSDEEGNEHPAVSHMLDVAACAEQLIAGHSAFRHLSGVQRKAMVLLVALHDVGKLSESFRALIREGEKGKPLHWELSDHLLCNVLDKALEKLGADLWVRAELYAAVAGHHGQPPMRGDQRDKRKKRRAVGSGEQTAQDWVSKLLELFPNASLEDMTAKEARALSWVLSGLTVASDWVGSNTDWFPLQPNRRDVDLVLANSRHCAECAVKKTGLIPPRPATTGASALIGLDSLRPMQESASMVALEEGPLLAIIEDSTGTGKTEAALILAQRMMVAGKARGIFFALPTMATSNAMFERMRGIAPRLFETSPSVVLTHSRAKLSEAMQGLQGASADGTPETDCATWLTDSRRKSLLATVGVGTVDQALLGILPTRFSTLRLFGLADKVLIVDEAHSYDPYMEKQLEALLKMQARLGGSAILMTATLPLEMREKYVCAFQKGLLGQSHEFSDTRYPSIHLVGRKVLSQGVEPDRTRSVLVERIADADGAMKFLQTAAKNGAACVWVRNSVDDAIEAAGALKRQGMETDLLHARFALIDRLRHEQALMLRFGKHGERDSNRILVATQVVEASLDLDFDAMVSDLAPIGSLVQRTGRLWRHMDVRPEVRRPVPAPILHVVSPDPDEVRGDDWLSAVLCGGAWVYRLDHQWLTAKAVFDTGEIKTPAGLRALLEAVHGDGAPPVPDMLEEAEYRAEADAYAHIGMAQGNVVDAPAGYFLGTRGAVGKDALFPTRLGEPQVTMVLARHENNRLVPWANENDLATAWALSEVTASRKRFEHLLPDQDRPEVQEIKKTWPKWRRETYSVCAVKECGAIGENLLYDNEFGLRIRATNRVISA